MNDQKWVDIFGNAPSLTEWKPEQYAKNITLSYPVEIPFDGFGMKLRFSNRYGKEAVTIDKYSVCKGDEIIFFSENRFTMQAGEEYMTEPFTATFGKGDVIKVSFYLKEFTNMTSGVYTSGPLSGGKCGEGDYTQSIVMDPEKTVSTNWNYFLTDVYLQTADNNHTIVCFGDSITAQDWPDYMYRHFMESENNHVAIVRKAVSGTRLLRQYSCHKYRSYGIKGDIRFPHESEIEGADCILIQHGINDIIHPVGEEVNAFRPWSDLPTAEEMTGMLQEYIRIAREKNLKVYLGTLLPIEGWRTYADFREELRQAVNAWIRETDLADGVVDFDKAVRNEKNPSAFGEGFDSGDHLHPSVAAYARMGKCAFEKLSGNYPR